MLTTLGKGTYLVLGHSFRLSLLVLIKDLVFCCACTVLELLSVSYISPFFFALKATEGNILLFLPDTSEACF